MGVPPALQAQAAIVDPIIDDPNAIVELPNSSDEASAVLDEPKKRGRGRPRKVSQSQVPIELLTSIPLRKSMQAMTQTPVPSTDYEPPSKAGRFVLDGSDDDEDFNKRSRQVRAFEISVFVKVYRLEALRGAGTGRWGTLQTQGECSSNCWPLYY
jgi:hypothetical protein